MAAGVKASTTTSDIVCCFMGFPSSGLLFPHYGRRPAALLTIQALQKVARAHPLSFVLSVASLLRRTGLQSTGRGTGRMS